MENKRHTIQELAKGFRSKEFSSVEITKSYLEAISHDTRNAFITVNDKALDEARTADRSIAKGKTSQLAGIPIAVKDVLTTQGLRTTAGSKMLADYIPSYTATAVQRLQDAGMVLLGKTNCDEFAMGSSNENSAFGPVKNPHDPTRVSGGSSGGSAAAVAAGLAPVALGTDTGGSVRLPASFCGVIGLKPTYGRISRYGLMSMASSLDQVGIFSATAYDAALLLRAMSGFDEHDATSAHEPVGAYEEKISEPLRSMTIGIPKEFLADSSVEVRKLIEGARSLYQKHIDVKFVEISLPHLSYSLAVYYIIMPSEVSSNMARYDGLRYGFHGKPDDLSLAEQYRNNRSLGFGPEVRRRILLGTYALSAGYFDAYYAQASKVRTLIKNDFDKAFKSVDLILGPTSPTPAFKLGEKQNDPLLMYLSDIYTVAANLAGIPAISYPAGSVHELPMGLQLMGPAWSEAQILSFVHQVLPLHRG